MTSSGFGKLLVNVCTLGESERVNDPRSFVIFLFVIFRSIVEA